MAIIKKMKTICIEDVEKGSLSTIGGNENSYGRGSFESSKVVLLLRNSKRGGKAFETVTPTINPRRFCVRDRNFHDIQK